MQRSEQQATRLSDTNQSVDRILVGNKESMLNSFSLRVFIVFSFLCAICRSKHTGHSYAKRRLLKVSMHLEFWKSKSHMHLKISVGAWAFLHLLWFWYIWAPLHVFWLGRAQKVTVCCVQKYFPEISVTWDHNHIRKQRIKPEAVLAGRTRFISECSELIAMRKEHHLFCVNFLDLYSLCE